MPTFDAALGVLPVEAVVPLVVCTVQAWHRVRPPHDRVHQLTGRQVAGRLDDPSERLMADDQMVVAPRGLAVLSGDELVVGPVDADRQHVDERLIRPGCRVRDLDQSVAGLLAGGDDDRSHDAPGSRSRDLAA